MTTKTLEQQARMKTQTFGVEVEMYGIIRIYAIEIIAHYFGTQDTVRVTSGSPYYTHECKDSKGRTWKVMRDSSIDTRDDHKAEMVTPPLTWDDIADLQQVVRDLRRAGAKSDPAHSCGVHVHVGMEGHTAQSLRTLANIMAGHESLIIDALKISNSRLGRWCRPVDPAFLQAINKEKPKSLGELARIWYRTQGGMGSSHYSPSRYHILNLHGAFPGYYHNGTVEFRLFQFDNPGRTYRGGLHAGKLKTFIQLSMALSQAAKDLRSASPKEPQHENPKFAMRTWMNRMGMIGDEFKTARDLLTRNLEGCAAWRHGTPQEQPAEVAELTPEEAWEVFTDRIAEEYRQAG